MDQSNDVSKNDLKNVLALGLTVQSWSVILVYALKKNKTSVVQSVTKILNEFVESLADSEKEELEADMKAMVSQKSAEILAGLNENLSEAEMVEVIKTIKE